MDSAGKSTTSIRGLTYAAETSFQKSSFALRGGEIVIPEEARFETESVLDAARARTGLEDFGDDDFLEPLQVLLDSLDREARLSPIGRATQHARIVGSLATRLSAQDYFARHPEILEEEIQAPLVIVGLARTGSTMLHRLLSADPEVYSVRWWECRSPAPYPGSDWREADPRIPDAHAEVEAILESTPILRTMHPWDAEGPDEEIMLIEHSFLSTVPESGAHVPSHRDYVTRHDLRAGYDYMKRMLQFLQWQKRQSGQDRQRWVLKAPFHLAYIEHLIRLFPDVRFVQTHRDPVETTPSISSMYSALWTLGSDEVDKHVVGHQCLERWSWALGRCLASRDAGAEDRFIDVLYDENRRHPMRSIERIYEFIDRPFTAAARHAMARWGEDNRRDKRGAHAYQLEEFGLTRAAIEQAFAEYSARYLADADADANADAHGNADASAGNTD